LKGWGSAAVFQNFDGSQHLKLGRRLRPLGHFVKQGLGVLAKLWELFFVQTHLSRHYIAGVRAISQDHGNANIDLESVPSSPPATDGVPGHGGAT